MKHLLPSLAVLLGFLALLGSGDLILVDTATRAFVDQFGRQRIFHGHNVVFKGPPYHPVTDHFDFELSFSEQDAKFFHQYGFNAARLGMMWPGVFPTDRNSPNATYLQVMSGIIDMMHQYGIYALLDAHQDSLNEKYCGEGAPDWASEGLPETFPLPVMSPAFKVGPNGHPSPSDCDKLGFANNYFSFAVSQAFQRIYDNFDGLRDAFANFWALVAAEFRGKPNLLGYELINEPWSGDIWKDVELMIPTVADQRNLAPLYEILNTAIRQVDDQHMVLFEPVTWDDWGVGFTQAVGGPDFLNRSVLAYHFYQPPDIDLDLAFQAREYDMKRLQVAGFMTEFDAGLANLTIETMNKADDYLQSWTSWEYKCYIQITGWNYGLYYSNGSINWPVVKAMSRTYAQAIAGQTRSMKFDTATSRFTLQYITAPTSGNKTTEIYLNEAFYYPRGFSVAFQPLGVATWARKPGEQSNYLIVPHFKQGVLLTVIITAN